jgi:MFS family permease
MAVSIGFTVGPLAGPALQTAVGVRWTAFVFAVVVVAFVPLLALRQNVHPRRGESRAAF